MRRRHFEALQPICPVCRERDGGGSFALEISSVLVERDDQIVEGMLQCSSENCRREYPIIDGVPLVIKTIRSYVADNLLQIYARGDLTAMMESLLGDCCGPGSALDTIRQQLSSYAWDHYADLDPGEPSDGPQPGSLLRILDQGLAALGQSPDGPIVDLGCSVGRGTFALAEQTGQLVLGVDTNYAMLRIAANALRSGQVVYPRRRVGIVYDRRELPVHFENTDNVDFWACDCQSLPFVEGTFGAAVAMNLLDSVQAPINLLASITAALKERGQAILACPYDWSAAATPVENWLGGHSQRSPTAGDSAAVLRSLLESSSGPYANRGLRITHEADGLEWVVRLHDRSVVKYVVHLITARLGG